MGIFYNLEKMNVNIGFLGKPKNERSPYLQGYCFSGYRSSS